ncbi:hypothetical protein ABZ234_03905 [Nocardiopsis sp. NPDC006198]|uniref:hypothetical protein n=1 Tax=Nocardiopsis sp. NPDC006198 TaxID=3154472 RepID=UPI0033AA1F57
MRGRGEPGVAGDIKLMQDLAIRAMRHGAEIEVTTNAERRRAVLAHPDLAERLTLPPLNFSSPDRWEGYIPPEMWQQVPNNSPRRLALVAIYEEALSRATARTVQEAA